MYFNHPTPGSPRHALWQSLHRDMVTLSKYHHHQDMLSQTLKLVVTLAWVSLASYSMTN